MFVINVKGNIISVQETESITSGSVNVYQCRFAFDDSWEGFFRSAVFRAGAMIRTVPLDMNDMCVLPWELLAKKNIGLPVEVSVYGAKGETEILPTIWDKMGRVRSGSEPGEDAKEPTPTVYNQLTNLVRIYSDKVAEESKAAAKYAQDAGVSAQTAVAAISGINDYVSAAAVSAASAKECENKITRSEANAAVSAESASVSAAAAEEWSRKAEQAAGGGVLSFNGRSGEVTPQSGDYTAEMVGADASGAAASALTNAKAYTDSKVPTKVSQLTNDKGYITGYTETDPTVPSWAKAASKPTYTYSEVGAAASSHNHAAGNITSGTLAVARGGTGVTANPSMLVNLGSTSAASVFAASPRPGVTGTLPVARGGTGATTAAAARTNLGAAPAIQYGTSDVTAGAASSYAEGTLYVVIE